MADETTTPKPATTQELITKRSAGCVTVGRYDGEPVDTFKSEMLSRVGIPQDEAFHASLNPKRLGYSGNDVDRLPSPFPPVDYTGPLVTVADWFACADATKIMTEQLAANFVDNNASGLSQPDYHDQSEGS